MGKRVLILGGGMGGLTTAWQITNAPDWRKDIDSVHVYQMGWRLGGKCATGRGPMGRVEEHGIHLFGGGYYNALPMMLSVYRELFGAVDGQHQFDAAFERQRTSVRVTAEGFKSVSRFPRSPVGLAQPNLLSDGPRAWLAKALRGIRDSTLRDDADAPSTAPKLNAMFMQMPGQVREVIELLPMLTAIDVAGADTALQALTDALAAGQDQAALSSAAAVKAAADSMWPADADDELPLALQAVHVALGGNQGQMAIGLVLLKWSVALDYIAALAKAWLDMLISGNSLQDLDEVEFHACLKRHGARPATIWSELAMSPLSILYQYRNGDNTDKRNASLGAGAYLHWVLRTFAYIDVPFWFFDQGTGDTVIGPLYKLLHQRGVQFHFFRKVESLQLSADGSHVAGITLRVQADTVGGAPYAPLAETHWPSRPLHDQLQNGAEVLALPADALEDYWCNYRADHTEQITVSGRDDAVVFAISLGAVPFTCQALLQQQEAWQRMVQHIATVETQSLQVWLDADSQTLGVNDNAFPTIPTDDTGLGCCFATPYDGFSDFSLVLRHEHWPAGNLPRGLWYFSDVIATPHAQADLCNPHYPQQQWAKAYANARIFLDTQLAKRILPQARVAGGIAFDDNHLVVPDPSLAGSRLAQQYIRANLQPSERYVQALVATTKYRLHAGRSEHFRNLYLAGDWTFNGLNVGCVEATVMSGLLAGNDVLGKANRAYDVVGYFPR